LPHQQFKPERQGKYDVSLPDRETQRLDALYQYRILDTPREAVFDELAELAADLCGTPIGVINLIGDGRQFFKAEVGLGVRETPLETSSASTHCWRRISFSSPTRRSIRGWRAIRW
jgi:hypothetical protein